MFDDASHKRQAVHGVFDPSENLSKEMHMKPGSYCRVMKTKIKPGLVDEAAIEWRRHIEPFKKCGLERAFMVVNRETGDYLSITIWESRQAQETNAVSNEQASSRDTMTKKYFDGAPMPATYELLSIVE